MKLYFYKRTVYPKDDRELLSYNHSLGIAGYKNPQSVGSFITYGTMEEAIKVTQKSAPKDKRLW